MASANSRFLPKRLADAYFTGTFKFLLTTTLPDETALDTWDFRSDVTGECPATGNYATGGVTVTVTVGAVDTANNRVAITISDAPTAWTTATISAAVGGWLYKSVGSAATDELISYVEFASATSSTGGTFALDFTAPIYINA